MKTNLKPIALGFLLAVICAKAQSPPRFEPLTFEANRPRVSLLGNTGSNYVIESSRNLNNWSIVYSGMATNGHLGFVHSAASNSVKQFYRAYAGNPPTPPIRFVIPRPDTNRTVSTLVTSAGGSCDLYLEGAARVTLTFPSNTVADARYVTMTLITNVVGLPFGRGILGAVRIEPDDLNIIGAAALEFTFNTGSNFDRRQVVSFACDGDGFDFRLTPDRVRTNSASLRLTRAGVFGSCLATAQELAPFAAFSAASATPSFSPAGASSAGAAGDGYDYLNASMLCFPERIAAAEAIQEQLQSDIDAISERIGVSLAQARQAQLAGATDDGLPTDQIGLEACAYYHDHIRPLFAQVENNCSLLKVLAGATLGIARQVQLMGYTSCPELLSLDGLPICSGARACLDEIKQCCQRMPEQRDSFKIDLVSAIRQQSLIGVTGQAGCFDLGDADVENILEGCSDLIWNGTVRITEMGGVQESDDHFIRFRDLSRVFEGVVTDAFEIGDFAVMLTITGDLAYSDKTTSINRKVCPTFGGKNCGDEAVVRESSAAGKQEVTAFLGLSGTDMTYTISIGNGVVSAPTKEDTHGYAVQNCNTCTKVDYSDQRESPAGGAVPTLFSYQGSLSSSNSVQGASQMEGQFDVLGPSEITFKWDFSRRKGQP